MLPCNVVVRDRSDGQMEVAAIDPVASCRRSTPRRSSRLRRSSGWNSIGQSRMCERVAARIS